MTFHCRDLDRALASEDAALLAAAHTHARDCEACRREIELADALHAAAPALRRTWESPHLWPAIAAAATARPARPAWHLLAAAAVLLLAVGASLIVMRDRLFPASSSAPATTATATDERLLSEQALAAVEAAEAQYVNAIEALAREARPRLDASASPLLVNLRERLLVIDAAIAECRLEIDRNRFNAHLRRQLLTIYQEKRRTLEEIRDHDAS